MSFNQEKIDRASVQSLGIFNTYVYRTEDTIAAVEAAGYFADCRFAELDGPATNSTGWDGGVIECRCSDGYMIGIMEAATGTLYGAFSYPTVITQADFLQADSPNNQIPATLGEPLQINFGPAQTTPQFDVSAAGDLTCNITGQYRFVFTGQAGRVGGAGFVNLFFRLLRNGTQIGDSVLARLDNGQVVTPLRFNLTIDLEAGDVLAGQVVQDTSGIAGSGGLYALQPEEPGWNIAPSATVQISQLSLVV